MAVLAMLGFADVFCGMSIYAQSARLQGFAVRVLGELGVRLLENEMLSFRMTSSRLKQILGEESFNKELEAGRALLLDQAIEITSRLKF